MSDTGQIIVGADIVQNVDDAIAALVRGGRNVYQRDGALVRVTHDPERNADGVWQWGSPRVVEAKIATLTEQLSICTEWLRPRKTADGMVLTKITPPRHVVEALAARGEWENIPPLTGVCETPFVRRSGTICDAPGYDKESGYLYEPSGDICPLPIPDPDQHEAAQALNRLVEPFREFPWSSPASMYAAASCVLTLLARPAIDGPVPLLALDKNVPGAGGTLGADTIAIIATGRTAPRLSWPPDETELEKVLGALALGAANLVCFDNLSTPLRGGPLDKVLTCDDRVQLRILGQTKAPAMRWRATMIATGNNISIESDTVRRVLVARMESALERPEDRQGFRIPDLRAWTREHRGELVDAALTVLRGYIVAGRPDMKLRPWGSFESWASLVASAIVWAGGADVMDARILDAGRDDPERGAVVALVRDLPKLCPDGTSLKSLVSILYPAERLRGEQAPDEWDALRDAVETLANAPTGRAPDAKKLGNAIRKYRGRVVTGRRLTSAPNRKDVQIWKAEPVSAGSAGSAGSLPTLRTEDKEGGGYGVNLSRHSLHSRHDGVAS